MDASSSYAISTPFAAQHHFSQTFFLAPIRTPRRRHRGSVVSWIMYHGDPPVTPTINLLRKISLHNLQEIHHVFQFCWCCLCCCCCCYCLCTWQRSFQGTMQKSNEVEKIKKYHSITETTCHILISVQSTLGKYDYFPSLHLCNFSDNKIIIRIKGVSF